MGPRDFDLSMISIIAFQTFFFLSSSILACINHNVLEYSLIFWMGPIIHIMITIVLIISDYIGKCFNYPVRDILDIKTANNKETLDRQGKNYKKLNNPEQIRTTLPIHSQLFILSSLFILTFAVITFTYPYNLDNYSRMISPPIKNSIISDLDETNHHWHFEFDSSLIFLEDYYMDNYQNLLIIPIENNLEFSTIHAFAVLQPNLHSFQLLKNYSNPNDRTGYISNTDYNDQLRREIYRYSEKHKYTFNVTRDPIFITWITEEPRILVSSFFTFIIYILCMTPIAGIYICHR